MAGDVGLIAVEFGNYVANRAGAFFKYLQNAEALRLSQRTEAAGDALDHGIGKF
jgi:hypothetical protein